MISAWLLVLISITYISLLFLIAWAGDRHPGLYKRRLARTHIYGLSLAVYFTSWTFYGAVGRATQEGLAFLPIYLEEKGINVSLQGTIFAIYSAAVIFWSPVVSTLAYPRKSIIACGMFGMGVCFMLFAMLD